MTNVLFLVDEQILQPARADIVMIMDQNQQKIDVRVSDIIVSIAPAAVRTLIGVTSSLGNSQVEKFFVFLGNIFLLFALFNFRQRLKK